MSERDAKCACLAVVYDPEDVEIENPVTGKMVSGERARWRCSECKSEFGRSLWHHAVVKGQDDQINELQAKLAAVEELPCYGQWFMADPDAEDCRNYLSEQCPSCKLKATLKGVSDG